MINIYKSFNVKVAIIIKTLNYTTSISDKQNTNSMVFVDKHNNISKEEKEVVINELYKIFEKYFDN